MGLFVNFLLQLHSWQPCLLLISPWKGKAAHDTWNTEGQALTYAHLRFPSDLHRGIAKRGVTGMQGNLLCTQVLAALRQAGYSPNEIIS